MTRRSDEVISRYFEEEQRRQRRKGPGICRQDWRVRALVSTSVGQLTVTEGEIANTCILGLDLATGTDKVLAKMPAFDLDHKTTN